MQFEKIRNSEPTYFEFDDFSGHGMKKPLNHDPKISNSGFPDQKTGDFFKKRAKFRLFFLIYWIAEKSPPELWFYRKKCTFYGRGRPPIFSVFSNPSYQ